MLPLFLYSSSTRLLLLFQFLITLSINTSASANQIPTPANTFFTNFSHIFFTYENPLYKQSSFTPNWTHPFHHVVTTTLKPPSTPLSSQSIPFGSFYTWLYDRYSESWKPHLFIFFLVRSKWEGECFHLNFTNNSINLMWSVHVIEIKRRVYNSEVSKATC